MTEIGENQLQLGAGLRVAIGIKTGRPVIVLGHQPAQAGFTGAVMQMATPGTDIIV
ncbi:hypothetical protein NTJ19_002854 [Yersinia ruckeri]|uniref:hypothetical protein n=1 Tax=Yersinia ruckeri TaxID=29486 RepID=UPI0012D472A9|nr:hypothetical protein [Yersinia ruckeri]EKN4199400.1 hypothetical protein [Yersinia ruckeri]EKN4205965.1 hypothetical protein [Yersinia ruckeri]EKN4703286.1 hypothetical protein [Yersinia ruckeri]ELI6453016.1 hypothetical protein [Yersinia ruckeri]